MTCMIIGIAGGSGSGKTFFAETLAKKLGQEHAFVLYQDSYYIDQSERFDHDGGAVNFDHPNALDFDLMAKHLIELKEGKPIDIPVYDFATHKRLATPTYQAPKKIVLVDGILILTQPKLRAIFDQSIFVHTPEDIRYERRLTRDVNERGRTAEGVKSQFEKQVKPMHDEFVEPSKQFADIISSGTDINIFNEILDSLVKKAHSIL